MDTSSVHRQILVDVVAAFGTVVRRALAVSVEQASGRSAGPRRPRAAGVQLVGADTDLGAQAKAVAVRKARAGVVEHARGIHLGEKASRPPRRPGPGSCRCGAIRAGQCAQGLRRSRTPAGSTAPNRRIRCPSLHPWPVSIADGACGSRRSRAVRPCSPAEPFTQASSAAPAPLSHSRVSTALHAAG
jgi:hypothetical protein